MLGADKIEKEFATLAALLQGASISRFGDGELRLARGVSVGHQKASKKMQEELMHILREPTKCLVGIPYISENSPKSHVWKKYGTKEYQDLYNPNKNYHSAFITRPDSAPWIDVPHYWSNIKKLWKDRDVICVCGSNKGFRLEEMEKECKSVQFIHTLPEEAYAEIDNIEAELGAYTDRLVLLAVGATATVLAWRLAERGFQALDLGHISMFMRRRGLFDTTINTGN